MRAFCSSVDGEDESELEDVSGLVVSAAGEDGGLGGESSLPPMLAPHVDEANNTISCEAQIIHQTESIHNLQIIKLGNKVALNVILINYN